MRILVLQLKRIGDTILTAPALGMLRSAWPDARIEVVLHGPSAGLGMMLPGVERVHAWMPGHLNTGILAHLAAGDWDLVLDFTGTDRSVMLALLSRATARFSYARHAKGRRWRQWAADHEVEASVRDLSTVDFHAALVSGAVRVLAGREPPPVPPPPNLSCPATVIPAGLPPRYVVIHPGTARDEKYWPPERWLAVARHLAGEQNLPLVLTGSADAREAEHLRTLRADRSVAWLDLAGKLDLVGSAAVIAGASLVLTVDSAAMHLAGQFGRPQIALFGPTNPFHWAPRHPLARVFHGARGVVDPAASLPDQFKAESMEVIPAASVIAICDGLGA